MTFYPKLSLISIMLVFVVCFLKQMYRLEQFSERNQEAFHHVYVSFLGKVGIVRQGSVQSQRYWSPWLVSGPHSMR